MEIISTSYICKCNISRSRIVKLIGCSYKFDTSLAFAYVFMSFLVTSSQHKTLSQNSNVSKPSSSVLPSVLTDFLIICPENKRFIKPAHEKSLRIHEHTTA